MDGSASLLQALGLQSNCWLCRCAGVKIGRESCDNSLHQLSVRARDPPLTVTTHHHHPHGRLCNAQPSELSAALVTASNKSFYFSLLAGWCRAVNGTSRISQCPKKALTIGTLVYKDHNQIAHQLWSLWTSIPISCLIVHCPNDR